MIRAHDKYGQPESGAELRYVQEYLTDADPNQPVQVKMLRWDGAAFVAYGAAFRIGDATTPTKISAGDKFWIVWLDDAQRWYPISGGGPSAEKYRLIRGQAVGAVESGTEDFLIDNVRVRAGGLDPSGGIPTVQVSVFNFPEKSYADDEWVTAIYSPAVTAYSNWEALKTGGAGGEPVPIIVHRSSGGDTAIDGAERVGAGPTVRPTEILATEERVEKLEENANLELVPSGEFLDCIYRDGEPVKNPAEGHVLTGEAVPLSDGRYLITIIYCKSWEE